MNGCISDVIISPYNAIFLYAVGSLATFIIEGYIRGIFRENKLSEFIREAT